MDAAAMMVAAKQAETQMALAAKMAKMNLGQDEAMASLIEQAAANLDAIVAAAPPGTGLAVDIRV